MTVHALRHAYVSKLFERGVPLEVISGLVRHASPSVTRAVYLHLRPETRTAAASVLDDLFAETGS
jgi:integrase